MTEKLFTGTLSLIKAKTKPSKVATGTILTPFVWHGQVLNPRPPTPDADTLLFELSGPVDNSKIISIENHMSLHCYGAYFFQNLYSPAALAHYFCFE